MKKRSVLIVYLVSLFVLGLFVIGCSKVSSPSDDPTTTITTTTTTSTTTSVVQYPQIAGSYIASYNYRFDCLYYTSQVSSEGRSITITQNESSITVNDQPGTIDLAGNVSFSGHFVTEGGTQNFTGTYNASTDQISGTFSGTGLDRYIDDYYYDGTVTEGIFTYNITD